MPLYEYQCDSCGVRFERIQKFSDPLETVCPTCGGTVHKLLSSPAIQFKGSGFYITDYARKGDAPASKASSGDSKESKGTGDSKDSKDSNSKDSKGSSESSSSADAKPAASSDTSSTTPKT